MTLKFLMGASGHGKTYRLYQDIIKLAMENPQRKYILIVPEQSSLQAEKDIVRMHPNHGVFNIEVLTFGRMAYRIFDELGVDIGETIDDTGKNLIIRKLLSEVQDSLKIIKAYRKQGFVNEVKSMISEFKQYGIKPDMLEAIIKDNSFSDRMKDKLRDILTIYRQFEASIENKYTTVEERPEAMLSIMSRSHYFDDAFVAFDDYTGFTPIQYKIIEQILTVANEVVMTVTIPENEPNKNVISYGELFSMSKTILQRMGQMADRLHITTESYSFATDYDRYRFAKTPELAFLEDNLFRYNGKIYDKEAPGVVLCRNDSVIDEIQNAASYILKYVREENLRFRDISVITGDIGSYKDELIRIFSECKIPFFIDSKRSMLGNPMVELIRSLLAIAATDFSYESVFGFLKNPLCSIDYDQICILENYVISYGFRGRGNWNKNFERRYKGKEKSLSEVNETRQLFMDTIDSYVSTLCNKEATVHDVVMAVYNFIEYMGLYEKMDELAKEAEAQCEDDLCMASKASEYRQIYRKTIELLEQLDAILGAEIISIDELCQIIDAGFEEMKIGIIPPSVDCVTVGDIERSRLEHVKVLFVLGVNEGLIPKAPVTRGILSEAERILLYESDIELAPTANEKSYIQNYYLYLNMTEPEKALHLSYHTVNQDGSSAKASRIYQMIKKMFSCVKEIDAKRLVGIDRITYADNVRHFVDDLGNDYICDLILYYYMTNPAYSGKFKTMINLLMEEAAKDSISREAAAELYSEFDRLSVSRIEGFAKCPFSHYAKYGLNLEPRLVYEMNALDVGTLFHSVLEGVANKLRTEKRHYGDLTEDERLQLVAAAFEVESEYLSQNFFADSSTNTHMKKRLEGMIDKTIWALGEQINAGEFRPSEFEYSFDDVAGMPIRGKIDRIDTCVSDDKLFVKIIDYKSYEGKVTLNEIYAGIKLQLMVYLKASLEKYQKDNPAKRVVAAGTLYNRIDNPILTMDSDMDEEQLEDALVRKFRPTGIVGMEAAILMDDWDVNSSKYIPVSKTKGELKSSNHLMSDAQLKCLSGFAVRKMSELNENIKAGEVAANPYEGSCEYCQYNNMCGFDRGNTSAYRRLLDIEKDDNKWEKFGYKEGDQ